ncbi:TetR/AcrR family transcriptional regulator [Camelimonas abortus]|uniref:TetR/AcrR family transcriptional regulator n=1 Tax=Camelimonas abortus TaxID=1017184 RepID=A0ABV7LGQ7_9HYPH
MTSAGSHRSGAAPGAESHAPGADTAANTRARILAAGMRCFARRGYAGATTRLIAAEAGCTLPVIAYHFGNKQGLYQACAEEVLERYRQHMLELATDAWTEARRGRLDAGAARALLVRVLHGLVDTLGSEEEEQLHTGFIMRELNEPGPAYEFLLRELWRPGSLLVADLLAIAGGRARAGAREKAAAMMLISSLTAFSHQAAISLRIMKWRALGLDHRALLKQILTEMVEGLLAAAPAEDAPLPAQDGG